MGAFNVFNRLISTFLLNFEYLSAKLYSNDSSNNPEFLDSLVFAIKVCQVRRLESRFKTSSKRYRKFGQQTLA